MDISLGNINEVKELLHSLDEEVRRHAIKELSNYPFIMIKNSLLSAMGDESWRVRKEAVELLVSCAGSDVNLIKELIELLRAHENAGLRNSAAESLEKLGMRSVNDLCQLVTDSDHDVRKFAIDILGSIGNPACVPVLILALGDQDPNVKAAAAENLGKIGDDAALSELLKAITTSDIWLKFSILEAIAKIGKPVPLEIIAPLAKENLLKKAIYECLSAIGGVEVLPLLLTGLQEPLKNAREAAVIGIMNVRDRLKPDEASRDIDQQLYLFRGSSKLDALIALLDTTDKVLTTSLLRLFEIIGDVRTAPNILPYCQDERFRDLCVHTFRSMGVSGESYLIKVFPDANLVERRNIAFILGELNCKQGRNLLISGMKDSDPGLRLASVHSVGKIKFNDLLEQVAFLLDDESPDVQEGARLALHSLSELDHLVYGKLCSELASSDCPEKRRDAAFLLSAINDLDRLSLLVKDEQAIVRKAAVDSLASLKSTLSSSHLIMALMDEDPDVRIAAATALGSLDGEEVVESLILTIRDENPWVQCAALKSLANISSDAILSAISALIPSAEGPVLITALETIAYVGGEQSNSYLIDALESADDEVVKTAMELLTGKGDEWIYEKKEKLMNHPRWDVRLSFIKSLSASLEINAVPILCSALEAESDPYVKEVIQDLIGRLR